MRTNRNNSGLAILIIILVFLFLAVKAKPFFIFSGERGNGNVIKQERKLTDFLKIKVSYGIDVIISQGDSEKVTVEADENLVDLIKTEVKDQTLKIYHEENISKAKKMCVYVTVKDLNSIIASSGSDVTTEKEIKLDKLVVEMSSGSDGNLKLNANELICETSSGSDLELSGKSKTLDLTASSGSDINAYELEAEYVSVKTSSGSDAEVFVTNQLKVRGSSGSDVRYKGSPKNIDNDLSSGASVRSK
jgi:hypothetical protein